MGAAALFALGSCLCGPALSQAVAPAAEQPAVIIAATTPGASATSAATPAAVKESIEKHITRTEDKIIERAKEDVKKLDSVPDEATLAELNRVRQTISRIEAMIDVEKRLNELERLRNDRRGGSAMMPGVPSIPAGLAEAIPASAFSMPQPGGSMQIEPKPLRSHRPTIVRVVGSGGRYTAVLKTSGDDTKSVRVGDKVSDDETVRSITPSTVEIGGKGSSYTLHVKNVDMVHSMVH
jgi:type IV pilus biogenesis protein PilP